MKIKSKRFLKKIISIMTIILVFCSCFLFQTEKINAQTLASNVQSTYGSPYAKYTFSVSYSSRTSTSIKLTVTCKGALANSSSLLGQGKGLKAGIKVKDFWSFIQANQMLDKLYVFSKRYEAMSPQEQIIFLSEAEKVFAAFDKIPDMVWEDEYRKYSQVVDAYKSIRLARWNVQNTSNNK